MFGSLVTSLSRVCDNCYLELSQEENALLRSALDSTFASKGTTPANSDGLPGSTQPRSQAEEQQQLKGLQKMMHRQASDFQRTLRALQSDIDGKNRAAVCSNFY